MKRLIVMTAAMALVASCMQVPGRKDNFVYAEAQRAPNAVAPMSAAIANPMDSTVSPDGPVAVKKIVKVGLLLPLTGRHADLGKAMQDAATVSLFDKYARLSVNQQSTKVELIPVDTGDSPELARKAMATVLEKGVSLVIGPVFGDATEAAAPIAATKHIPVLSFSNSRAKSAGTGTYLMGFSPQDQTLRVMRHAVNNGKRRIGVLVPKSPLGDVVLDAARTVAKETGKVVLIESQYAPQAVGLDAALVKLMPEGKANFDALMLAESGEPLEAVLRALSAKGVTQANMQLMGTGVWDDAALLASTNLDGAWLASSTPMATAEFDTRFRSTYGYAPPRVSSLAYDAVALVVTLAVTGREFSAENLTGGRGFIGPANGLFRLRNGALAERGLAVLQVEGSNLKVVSPAPTGF